MMTLSKSNSSRSEVGLSVIIPAYNEAARLGQSLVAIADYLESSGKGSPGFEILVVDDGSSDATRDVARDHVERGVRLISLAQNRGKGGALQVGVAASRGARVLLTDADLSTPISDLARLEEYLESVPIVIGSRAVAGSDVELSQPFYRVAMGKIFNSMIRLAGLGSIRDTQCGFKLLDGDVARRLFPLLVTSGFAYDVELLWLGQRLGYQVQEVGVRWRNSAASTVDVLRDPPRMLLDIARFRWLHRGKSFEGRDEGNAAVQS